MIGKTTELTFLVSSRKRRIAAFLIDHFVMTFLMVSIVFLTLGPNFMDENNPGKIMANLLAAITLGFVLYFAKDCFNGVSIGKWIMGIMVRDEDNQEKIPSFGRLFLRNLLIVIWPLEFIVFVTNDNKKRLGDKIAKTIVVKSTNKPKRLPRILALIGVGIIFSILLLFIVGSAMKNSDAYKVAIIEIEKSEDILTETSGIKGYGIMPSGNISVSSGQGQAQLEIKVLGSKKNMNVSVYLEKELNGQWKLLEMQK